MSLELGLCPQAGILPLELGSWPQTGILSPSCAHVPWGMGMKARPGGGTGQEVTPAPARGARGGDGWWHRAEPPEAVGQPTPPRAGRGGCELHPKMCGAAPQPQQPPLSLSQWHWLDWSNGAAGCWEVLVLGCARTHQPGSSPSWHPSCTLRGAPRGGWGSLLATGGPTQLILRAVPALGGLHWGVMLQLPWNWGAEAVLSALHEVPRSVGDRGDSRRGAQGAALVLAGSQEGAQSCPSPVSCAHPCCCCCCCWDLRGHRCGVQ